MADRVEIKKQLHCARVNLAYRKKHASPEIVSATQTEVDRLAELYADTDPARFTMRVRSPYFIGPRQKRGKRGDGPTIICFRCSEEKPVSEYYKKGTVCKCCIVKRSADWAEKNPDKSKDIKRSWDARNRERRSESQKKWRAENPLEARAKDKEKRKRNRLSNNKAQREYLRRRKKKDPAFRALLVCRQRLWILRKSAGVKKKLRSAEAMGISRDGFFAHIESLFLPGMSWSNYGKGSDKWNIEHIIPCSRFDHSDTEQVKACWHYTNLRPMWEPENLSKSDWLPCGARGRDKRNC